MPVSAVEEHAVLRNRRVRVRPVGKDLATLSQRRLVHPRIAGERKQPLASLFRGDTSQTGCE